MITKFKNAQNIFYNQYNKRTCLIKKALLRGCGDLVGGCRGENYFNTPYSLKSFIVKQSLKRYTLLKIMGV
ncbi:hypothetical protein ECB99_01615 [Helicobacter pylori]|nr:hypothetical protein ECB99_01615 [Helicobacter pylori]RVZ12835.1 hypothetical protein EC527_03160 [Helicobacter pylori]